MRKMNLKIQNFVTFDYTISWLYIYAILIFSKE